MFNEAHSFLRAMLGPQADFRRNQWEAIEALAVQRRRILIIERAGWGKSIVYFLATKLLRRAGTGPTLLISPYLSLMRNQVLKAQKIGIRAQAIHRTNHAEWEAIEKALANDACDILLVPPERLSNERFLSGVLPTLHPRIGMLIVDEAHCISDCGHDFRQDYRRIQRILEDLPGGVPVLATTATANNRVAADIRRRLGDDLLMIRGPLARTTLRLQNLAIPKQAVRLAWLAENLPKFTGSGIIYCLTVADTQRVAAWLRSKGIDARSYHGGIDHAEREALEHVLLDNKLKALVATSALGIGLDKPDLSFVVHFQRPGSVVAYYQQVSQAGRSTDKAYGILLAGEEDDDIINYFIDHAFPRSDDALKILDGLAKSDGMTNSELLTSVNISRTALDTALKTLEVDGAIRVDASSRRRRFFRIAKLWRPDREHIQEITRLRREELQQMQEYIRVQSCLMEYLARALDDQDARPCGVCAVCQGRGFEPMATTSLIAEAVSFLEQEQLFIEPRKMWATGLFPDQKAAIPPELRLEPGRVLCCFGDSGWGKHVHKNRYAGQMFDDDLLSASIQLIREQWKPNPLPVWVAAVPSSRQPNLVPDFAARLASELGLPFAPVLVSAQSRPEQRTRRNSTLQACNALEMLGIRVELVQPGPVLLVDDIIDSGWTLTVCAWLLRKHGSGIVYPFALARSSRQSK